MMMTMIMMVIIMIMIITMITNNNDNNNNDNNNYPCEGPHHFENYDFRRTAYKAANLNITVDNVSSEASTSQ